MPAVLNDWLPRPLPLSIDWVEPADVAGQPLAYGVPNTPLGPVLVAWLPGGLCHLELLDQWPDAPNLLADVWPRLAIKQRSREATAWAERIFEGDPDQSLSVVLAGSPLERQTWQALLTIPLGEVRSYQQVAALANRPRAVRAVASAVGRNRLAYAIPCHRVIRSSGQTGNYRWGGDRKQRLLDLEARAVGRNQP